MSEVPVAIKVYEAINNVTGELSKIGISKDRKNQQQGYTFRGIDDVYLALSPLLAKYKLCILPRVTDRVVAERETKSGGAIFSTILRVEFDFVSAEDGSKHTVVIDGEAMDSGDKSCNKSLSAAYKYACMQAFCIPTEGDNDVDAVTHEVVTKQAADIKTVQDKLHAAKSQPAASPVTPKPFLDENIPAQPSAFIWQVGKTHSGKRIEEIPLDYLEWFVANGKKADHVEACKSELVRVAAQNEVKLSALASAYLENVSASETVTECLKSVADGLSDENITVFEQTHIQETGDRKLAQLRKS